MKFDIVIVGGGMVGALLACALDPLSLRVAIIDSTSGHSANDPRLIALNHGSLCLLKNLNLFEALTQHAEPIQEVHVSHRGHFGSIRIRARELKVSMLGSVIPAKNINAALAVRLQKTSIQMIHPAKLVRIKEKNGYVDLILETPEGEKTIQTKMVIGADGSYSTVRDLFEIPVEQHDYKQSAIVVVTELAQPHQQIACERFLDEGAIAMLPLTHQRAGVIWTAPQEKITQLMQLNDIEFLQHLKKAIGFKHGQIQTIGERFVFPLKYIRAKKRSHRHALLIGNAAQTVHPLAAQGFNLAIHEVAWIAQRLSETAMEDLVLEELTKHRFSQTLNMNLSHYLNSLFASDFFPINIVRQAGMIGMGILGILKRSFAAYPAGLSGRVPRLLLDDE